jgi:hypothetical protein
MDSTKLTRTILEAERVGVLLYVLIGIIAAAIAILSALSSSNPISALRAGVPLVLGVAVLGIIIYLETQVWV